jgi:hypothetical protein
MKLSCHPPPVSVYISFIMEQKAVSMTNGENNNKSAAKTLDYVLEEIVGGAGRWQWGMLAIMYIVILAGELPLLERENQRRK